MIYYTFAIILFITAVILMVLAAVAGYRLEKSKPEKSKKICENTVKKKKRYRTYTKRWLTFILINGVIWVYLSYVLAFLDKIQIAETLSVTAVTSIIATMLGYFCKSAFEKKIGKEKEEYEDLFEKDIQ